MVFLGIVRLRLAVLGEPPDHERRPKTQGHANRHTENAPKCIHKYAARLAPKAPKVKQVFGISWATEFAAALLASPPVLRYCRDMSLYKVICAAILLAVGVVSIPADVIELKDSAAIKSATQVPSQAANA